MQEFFGLPELSARYGLSKMTIRRLWAQGRFPAPVKIGKSLRWRASDLEAWESKLAASPTIPPAPSLEEFGPLPTFEELMPAETTLADLGLCDFTPPEFSAEPQKVEEATL